MKIFKPLLPMLLCCIAGCSNTSEKNELDYKVMLKKPLAEISGVSADSAGLWAITDKPHAVVYRLDFKGKITGVATVTNALTTDAEAVTNDENYVYICDAGDNNGTREERQIIKVPKAGMKGAGDVSLTSEVITFKFEDEKLATKKKKNNNDCEAVMSMGDSLYLFTKRRKDNETELYAIPKTPGNYIARSVALYDSKGLITDAAINGEKNEVALCGYGKGHKFPFILLFTSFTGNDFFSGKAERIELADKPWDWQVEGITYGPGGEVYFTCEKTKEVASTLYAISRKNLSKLDKGKQ